jgi:phage replication-related protein YjqB (UPF0714/DUF867 family)
MADKYACFATLAANETAGKDYRVNALERAGAPILIVAPHGGSIEVGTSELAALIAGSEHSLFTFDGLKPRGRNRDLHITSHNFDHPACLALVSRHCIAIGIHGCKGESQIYVGGRDDALTALLAARLAAAGLPVTADGHNYPGRNPLNICNRGTRGRGAQLEITSDLRLPAARAVIAPVVRTTLTEYVPRLANAAA